MFWRFYRTVNSWLPNRARGALGMASAVALICVTSAPAVAEPLLPDMVVWAKQSPSFSSCYLYCGLTDTTLIQNKVLYRFIGALPNIGAGPLEIREVTHPDGTQDVFQRIHQSEGGVLEEPIGSFPNSASLPPRHLWLPGIAQYNLRTVTEGNGVGPIVSTHDKTSMAVVDGASYDTSLAGAPLVDVYDDVRDPILGISVGWADVYGTGLPGQWIELTGLPSGQYWLEVIVDPYNRIQESDETNNTTRVLLNFLVPPPHIIPGDYNQDDVVDAADYVAWRNTLGQTVSMLGTGADGDGDGVISLADYDVWRARFGNDAAGIASPSASAPEATAFAMVCTGLLAGCLLMPPLRRGCGAACR